MCFASCGSAPPVWGVETTYEVSDVSAEAFAEITTVLRQNGNPYGLQELRQEDNGPRRFKLTNVADMERLRSVQETIQQISIEKKVPVQLQRAALFFASVSGNARAQIELHGEATQGAEVWLDVGATSSPVQATVHDDGSWVAIVEANASLGSRQGWVYGVIKKGNVVQYIRVNVLDNKDSERVRPEEVPVDSVLHKRDL